MTDQTRAHESPPGGPPSPEIADIVDAMVPIDAPPPASPDDGPVVVIPPGGRFRAMRMLSLPFVVACLGVGLTVLVVMAAGSALFVFAIGIALSFFLVPVVNALVRHGWPRIGACIVVVASFVLITLAGLAIITIILVEQGSAFVQAWPSIVGDLQASYAQLDIPSWLRTAIDQVVTALQSTAAAVEPGTILLGVVQGILGMLGTLFALMLLPFFLFYLLKDQPKMARNFYHQLPPPWRPDVDFTIDTFMGDFAQYFKAELIVGTIMGISVATGMFIIGNIVGGSLASFALLLGLIAFVMELLPQIGPIISYIPALIIALTISPVAVVLVSVFYFIAFNIEGSVLVPTFEGHMVSFSGATVLLVITIGFALAGILGAIVALPVAAIIRDVFAHFFQKAQRESIVVDAPVAEPSPA